jgi:hypothetical protein
VMLSRVSRNQSRCAGPLRSDIVGSPGGQASTRAP